MNFACNRVVRHDKIIIVNLKDEKNKKEFQVARQFLNRSTHFSKFYFYLSTETETETEFIAKFKKLKDYIQYDNSNHLVNIFNNQPVNSTNFSIDLLTLQTRLHHT